MEYNHLDFIGIENIQLINNWETSYNPFKLSHIKRTDSDQPDWYIASIKMANNPIGSINSRNLNASAGTSIYFEEALIRSTGEALERYSSINYFYIDKAYFLNIDQNKGFVRCADIENAPKGFKKNGILEKIEHTQVINLIDNSIDYLPFETVHLGFIREKTLGSYYPSISTGCAFYNNEVTAIFKGICEVVERDAVMKWWYLNFNNTKKINIDTIYNYDVTERIRRIKEKNLEIHIFEISEIENFPVIFCLIKGNEFPYACFGGSCDTDIEKAIIKAIDEAISIRIMSKWTGIKPITNTLNFDWVNKLEDHMELYANWENSPIIDTLVSMDHAVVDVAEYPKKIKVNNFDDLQKMAISFKEKGFDIYFKDLTLPEVSKLGKVIKVVIPQMIPLSQSFSTRWLDTLLENKSIEEINPYPQPFS
jgi:thiazole/oxazole-forming peptide maturase SagD family component